MGGCGENGGGVVRTGEGMVGNGGTRRKSEREEKKNKKKGAN